MDDEDAELGRPDVDSLVQVLDYRSEQAPHALAERMPLWAVIVVSCIPCAAILIVRGTAQIQILILQFIVVPAAFVFFGPIWGELLFKGTRYTESGLLPFIMTIAVVVITSVVIAVSSRRSKMA